MAGHCFDQQAAVAIMDFARGVEMPI